VRRLYSTFAGGWPGMGLILMRLVTGAILVDNSAITLLTIPPMVTAIASALLGVAGLFLIVGLYTPIAGIIVALAEVSSLLTAHGHRSLYLLIAASGAALAMLGPGAWSVDARLFGWKRIEPSPRKR